MAEEQVFMAKSQMQHRHELETRVIGSNTRLAGRGQWFAFILGLSGLVGAMLLIHEGRELGGATAFLASLVSLVGVFVYGRKQQQKELAEKREEAEGRSLPPARRG
jgi:uncharacterized membrane protein